MLCQKCKSRLLVGKVVQYEIGTRRTMVCPSCPGRYLTLEQVVAELPPLRRWGRKEEQRRGD